MTAAKHFNPEMKGGLQLGLDLFPEDQEQHAAGPETPAGPALSEPTTKTAPLEPYEPGAVR